MRIERKRCQAGYRRASGWAGKRADAKADRQKSASIPADTQSCSQWLGTACSYRTKIVYDSLVPEMRGADVSSTVTRRLFTVSGAISRARSSRHSLPTNVNSRKRTRVASSSELLTEPGPGSSWKWALSMLNVRGVAGNAWWRGFGVIVELLRDAGAEPSRKRSTPSFGAVAEGANAAEPYLRHREKRTPINNKR